MTELRRLFLLEEDEAAADECYAMTNPRDRNEQPRRDSRTNYAPHSSDQGRKSRCQKYLIEGSCALLSCRSIHTWKPMQEEKARLIEAWTEAKDVANFLKEARGTQAQGFTQKKKEPDKQERAAAKPGWRGTLRS
jgi:hypothetical protein